MKDALCVLKVALFVKNNDVFKNQNKNCFLQKDANCKISIVCHYYSIHLFDLKKLTIIAHSLKNVIKVL